MRWTRPETWHLTLLFLGSVDPARVPELRRLVDSVVAGTGPYHARADQGDGRVSRGEGVAWLGLSQGAGMLVDAADRAADGCPADITDGPAPRRTRSAHLTLARKADRSLVQALRDQAHGPLDVAWRVDRIELVRSHLQPGGAQYETLHRSTL